MEAPMSIERTEWPAAPTPAICGKEERRPARLARTLEPAAGAAGASRRAAGAAAAADTPRTGDLAGPRRAGRGDLFRPDPGLSRPAFQPRPDQRPAGAGIPRAGVERPDLRAADTA